MAHPRRLSDANWEGKRKLGPKPFRRQSELLEKTWRAFQWHIAKPLLNHPWAFLPWFHLSSWHIFAIFLDLSSPACGKSLSCRMSQQVLATACYSSFLIHHLPSLQDCWKLLESQVRQGNRTYTGPIGNIRGNMSRRSSSIFCSPCCSHSESSKLWLIAWGSTRSRSIRRPRDKANRHPWPWQHPSSDAA